MDDQSQRLNVLFEKYASGSASTSEVAELLDLVSEDHLQEQILQQMQAEISNTTSADLIRDRWAGVLQKIQGRIALNNYRKTTKLWPRIGFAAAVALIISTVAYMYIRPQTDLNTVMVTHAQIVPGTIGATLTLSSGKKIRLSSIASGELASEGDILISKDTTGEVIYESRQDGIPSEKLNVLSTGNGETYRLRLPDGTRVWLNAASSLSYPAGLLKDGKRAVKLSGEAYFEVAKDKAHPFTVESEALQVGVLGTHFNVTSYADEPSAKVTLLEGAVQLNKQTVLRPNEQATVDLAGIHLQRVRAEKVISWTKGKFMFDRENLDQIMLKLARWYDIEVEFRDDVRRRNFTGTVSRFDNITKILDKLSYTNQVHFKIEGRRVIVMK